MEFLEYTHRMRDLGIKLFAALTYVVMIAVNFLANGLPINNRSTGEISDAYPNLFAPIGFTFSIWGVIYLLLAGYILYSFINRDQPTEKLLKKTHPFFIATSLANISWIFAWHYDYIGLSLLIMLTLLILLIKIADMLRDAPLTPEGKLFIWAPFSMYFGWITVATIANVTIFLVSVGWNGFSIADHVWTVVVLLVGATIGILRTLKDRNVVYGLVFVWAYLGILAKHLWVGGFDGAYPSIIATTIFALALFLFTVGNVFYSKTNKART